MAVFHAPAYSAGGGHANDATAQTVLCPLFTQYGVQVTLVGHNHYYAHCFTNGVHHITTGGGGAPLHTPDPGAPALVQAESTYEFVRFDITNSVMTVTAIRTNDTVIETFLVYEIPKAGFIASPISGGAPLTVTFTDTSTGSISNRFWSFGDGASTNLTATNVTHTYNMPGTNTVQLIVSGPSGVSTNTQLNLVVATSVDTVGDGIPDWWRHLHFGGDGTTTNAISCATSDPDGDGYINRDEFTFGAVPTNSNSVPAALSVTQSAYDFGTVVVGSSATANFTVTNTGPAAFSGTANVSGAPFAVVSGSPFTVPAGGSSNVAISFTPSSVGVFTGQVLFASNGGSASNTLTGAGAPALVLLNAVSRKTHGGAGTFDLNLNLDPSANPTVEPRSGGPATLVFTFNKDVAAADGTLSANEFTLTNATYASAAIVSSNLTLNLTNVVDQSRVTVVLNGISDLAGNLLAGTNAVRIRALYGDCNLNGTVSAPDVQYVKNRLLQTVNSGNFQADLNCSGTISAPDLQAVKNNLLHTAPLGGSLSAGGVTQTFLSASSPSRTDKSVCPTTLGEALSAPELKWSTNGDDVWAPTIAPDGSAAAWSGSIGDLQVSWVETTVAGPGTLSFEWKVSSELNADFLTFSIDGADQPGRISGEVDWQPMTFVVPNGTHLLRWTYAKNRALGAGLDAAWLRRVSYQPIHP
jgi:PKD repeat protein